MNHTPLVTAIITTHNRNNLVGRAIESVLNQTYENLECIVVDDASVVSAEVVCKNIPVPMEYVGVKDTFGGSGEPEELLGIFGLTWKEIYASALKAIERKEKGFSELRQVKDVEQYNEAL